jgi:transcriptional regulator with XRE-family HTH domain
MARPPGAGHATGPRSPTDTPWAPARWRLREMLERARRYAAAIREEPGLTQGELAEREGVSGPRVNQVLSFLRLDPSILADLTDLESENPVPSLDELFAIGRLPNARAQVTRYRATCAALRRADRGAVAQAKRQRGFEHLFARARAWQAALDRGQHRSLAALAQAEGISHHRVAQVLDLLTLAPEIQAALDVPFEALPAGITQHAVKALARLGVEAQRAWMAAFCAGRAGPASDPR